MLVVAISSSCSSPDRTPKKCDVNGSWVAGNDASAVSDTTNEIAAVSSSSRCADEKPGADVFFAADPEGAWPSRGKGMVPTSLPGESFESSMFTGSVGDRCDVFAGREKAARKLNGDTFFSSIGVLFVFVVLLTG